jgi:hypothetical protein
MSGRALELAVKAAVILGCLWVLWTAVRLQPDPRGVGTHEQIGMASCGFLRETGRPCITCGMTTSFVHMVRLQVPSAFDASPAGMLLFLLMLATPPWLVHSMVTRRPALRFLATRWGRWGLALLVAAIFVSWWWKAAMAAP